MCRPQPQRTRCILLPLAFILIVYALGAGRATAQYMITEIIDATGDGAGNGLDFPQSIAVDSAGNAYVVALTSQNAFKITLAGVITEIIDATGDGAGNSLLLSTGIAVDGAGNAYVTGRVSHNAFKITPAGVITEIIDATGDGAGNALDQASGIAVDAPGNVYVAGVGTNNAFKITPAGVITEIIDATGDGAGNGLDQPLAIAVDVAGNAYVAGFFSDNAFKITPGGVITEIIDATGDGAGNVLDAPFGIAVDASNNVYATGAGSHNVFKITPAGIVTEIIDATGDGAGNILDEPVGIAVDAAGNAYVAADLSHNAFMITSAGVITEIIDAAGDGASNTLSIPQFIAVDGAGNTYVTGAGSDNAFKITPDCNNNGIPDATDIADCPPGDPACDDCNNNGVQDGCDIADCTPGDPTCDDCNANGVPDQCDIAECMPGDPACDDCNANGVPDECDIAECTPGDPACDDCNANGVPDECDIADCTPGDPACDDCNANGVLDGCDISNCPPGDPGCDDCNANAVPDECDIAECTPGDPACDDCNANGAPDECDIANCAPGDPACDDCNANAVPDSCQSVAAARAAGLGVDVTIACPVISSTTDLASSGAFKSFHIQDVTGGITVLAANAIIDALLVSAIEGDSISISGTTSSGFVGLFQLNSVSGSLTLDQNHGQVGIPTPIPVTTADMQDFSPTAEGLESMLVTLTGTSFETTGTFAGSATYTVTDGVSNANVRIATNDLDLVGTPIPTGTVLITGILDQFDFSNPGPSEPGQGYQLLPRSAVDIILDCNNNAIPDTEDLAQATSPDCNTNGIPDECDIATGTSLDCNANGTPDECDPPPPARLFVDALATGANNGTSWTDALLDLQDAFCLASANVGAVSEIWVAEGIYLTSQDTDRAATFQLFNGVGVYGGFAGGEANLEDRDPAANVTMLTGDIAAPGETFDNAYHVVTGSGTDNTAILDGFTITSGNAHDGFAENARGGGMFNDAGSPTLTDCVFMANSAGYGGGMFNTDSHPVLTRCTFIWNTSGMPGGGGSTGGGMYNLNSNPTLIGCAFEMNTAIGGVAGGFAGGMNNVGSSPTLIDCTFTGNVANSQTGNSAAGGMYNANTSNPTLIGCTFNGNTADDVGAMFNQNNCNPSMTNCVFVDNFVVGDGAGVWNIDSDSNPTFTNCTFVGNTAGGNGGGMLNTSGSSPIVTNCIFRANADSGGMDASAQIYVDTGTPAVTYCNVQGGWPGAGNINTDPFFVDPLVGDLRLSPASPCNDAGDNSAVPVGVTTDRDGVDRFLDVLIAPDTGVGPPPIVDMGAFETFVDCNDNGIHDGTEFANCPGDPACEDCNTNGLLDECDIATSLSLDCDLDGVPDDCEPDDDGDTVINDCDNCPSVPNTDQADGDNDGTGDVCERLLFSVFEPFEAYTDQAEFEAVWTDTGNSEYVLSAAGGNPGRALSMPSPSGNFLGRYALNLSSAINPDATQTLVFSFDFWLDPAGDATSWNNARHYIELRGYSGGSFGVGDLQNIIALGMNNASGDTFSTQKFQGRVFGGPDWQTLDEGTAPDRSPGWHRIAAHITIDEIRFFVDDVLAETEQRPNAFGFDSVVLGSDLTAGGHDVIIDNVGVRVFQTTLFVDASAAPGGDGSGWATAYRELAEAIPQAGFLDAAAQVWVAQGTYTPDYDAALQAHTADRAGSFELTNGVTLYGGFPSGGGDGTFGARDPDQFVTTLSGDIGTISDNSDNSYHVVTGHGTDATAVLNGFTVTAGNADGAFPADRGGGMYNDNGGPSVIECSFTENNAAIGGGMHNWSGSDPTVTNCTFAENTATNGGGMANMFSDATVTDCALGGNTSDDAGGGMYNSDAGPSVIGCTFTDNTAGAFGGGGMYNTNDSAPIVTNCAFSTNAASSGGGMYNNISIIATVTGCTFSGNTASQGGGMYNRVQSSTIVTDCTFNANVASFDGGGMYNLFDSDPVVTNCTFSTNAASLGGAIYNNGGSPVLTSCTFNSNVGSTGGGVYNSSADSIPILTNCTFSGNTADVRGGAVVIRSSGTTLTNCTLSANSATDGGGGIYVTPGAGVNPTLTNCILWANSDSNGMGSSAQFLYFTGNTPVVNHSDVQGGWTGGGGIGNINADPVFARNPDDGGDGWGDDPATPAVDEGANDDFGDLHLQFGSPCIDAGNNAAVPPGVTTDLAGNPRIADGDGNLAATVDMGAHEFPVTVVDLDLDDGETVTLIPGGGGGDPTDDAQVTISNLSGSDDATVAVSETNEDLHPDAGGFNALGTTLLIETSLADGEFFMTVIIPINAANLGGEDPLTVDLTYYETGTGSWLPAVAGNTQDSPGYPGPVGDRFAVEDTVQPTLSTDLGDYGVFWNPTTLKGFAWANVDHVTAFSPALPRVPGDSDGDGDVDLGDVAPFVATLLNPGAATPNALSAADLNGDGAVNGLDIEPFVALVIP